jgi:hypothetical protein
MAQRLGPDDIRTSGKLFDHTVTNVTACTEEQYQVASCFSETRNVDAWGY